MRPLVLRRTSSSAPARGTTALPDVVLVDVRRERRSAGASSPPSSAATRRWGSRSSAVARSGADARGDARRRDRMRARAAHAGQRSRRRSAACCQQAGAGRGPRLRGRRRQGRRRGHDDRREPGARRSRSVIGEALLIDLNFASGDAAVVPRRRAAVHRRRGAREHASSRRGVLPQPGRADLVRAWICWPSARASCRRRRSIRSTCAR